MERNQIVRLPFQADSPVCKRGESNQDLFRHPNGSEWFDDHEELFLSPFGLVCLYQPYLSQYALDAPEVTDEKRAHVEAFAVANHMVFAIGEPGTGPYSVRGAIRQGTALGTVPVVFVLPTASPRGEVQSIADALALAHRVVRHIPASRSELGTRPRGE